MIPSYYPQLRTFSHFLSALLLSLWTLSSCSVRSRSLSELSGSFYLLSLADRDLEHLSPEQRPSIHIKAQEKRISGSTGCNSYMGQILFEGQQKLSFHGLISTLRACPDGGLEGAFISTLYSVRAYSPQRNASDTLKLLDAQGQTLMQLLPLKQRP